MAYNSSPWVIHKPCFLAVVRVAIGSQIVPLGWPATRRRNDMIYIYCRVRTAAHRASRIGLQEAGAQLLPLCVKAPFCGARACIGKACQVTMLLADTAMSCPIRTTRYRAWRKGTARHMIYSFLSHILQLIAHRPPSEPTSHTAQHTHVRVKRKSPSLAA